MKSIAIVFALLAVGSAGLCADDANWTSRVVEVKHVQLSDSQVVQLLGTLNVKASGPVNGYIALSGPRDAVNAAQEFLQKMDAGEKAEPDVDFRGWLLVDAAQDGTGALPTDLEPVAKQLRTAFGYHNLRLLSSFDLRCRVGHGCDTDGQMPSEFFKLPQAATYTFRINRLDVAGDGSGGRKLRIDNLEFRCGFYERPGVRLETGVDMTEGQKIVIGKTNVALGSEMPLILVLSARPAAE